jgi:tetratricopeptide (TPR) repeat protein
MARSGKAAILARVFLAIAIMAAALPSATQVMANGLEQVRLGNNAFKSGAFEDAIDAYSQAILSGELDIDAMAITFNNRGVVYGEVGDFDRAISDYQESLALRPNDATTLKNLRVAFVRRGNQHDNLNEFERAIADYTQALEIDSDHVSTLQRRAAAQRSVGNYAAARIDLQRAARLQPANQEVRTALGQVEEAIAASRQQPAQETDVTVAGADAEEPASQEAPAPTASQSAEAEAPATEAETPVTAVSAETEAGDDTAAAAVIEQAKRSQEPSVITDVDLANAKLFRAVSPVNFRAGPGNDFDRVGAIAQGDRVQVVGIDKGWMHVILTNGQQGYIYRKWLEPVEE